jgi:mobilome CxxCx(11)CxxC protein
MAATPMQPDPKFIDCRERWTHAYTTAAIFQTRAKNLSRKITLLTFFGFVLPVTLGSIIAAKTFAEPLLVEGLIWVAGVLGVIQIVISLWATVAKWPETLEACQAAATENSRLAEEFDTLAKQVVNPPLHFDTEYLKIKTQDDAQRIADGKQFISDEEKQHALRATLYQFGMTCGACKEKPDSIKVPNVEGRHCDACGGPIK